MRNWDLERLSNLPKVAYLGNCRAKICTQARGTGGGQLPFVHQCSDFGTTLSAHHSPKYPLYNPGASPSGRCLSLEIIWPWYYPTSTLIELMSSTIKLAKVVYLPALPLHLFIWLSSSLYIGDSQVPEVVNRMYSVFLMYLVFPRAVVALEQYKIIFVNHSSMLRKQVFEAHELEYHQEPKRELRAWKPGGWDRFPALSFLIE